MSQIIDHPIAFDTLADLPADFVTRRGLGRLRVKHRGFELRAAQIADYTGSFYVDLAGDFPGRTMDELYAFIGSLSESPDTYVIGLRKDLNRLGKPGCFVLAYSRADFDAWAAETIRRIDAFCDRDTVAA